VVGRERLLRTAGQQNRGGDIWATDRGNQRQDIKLASAFACKHAASEAPVGEPVFYPSRLLALFMPRAGRMSRSAYLRGFVLPFIAVISLTWLLMIAAPGLLGAPGYGLVALGWLLILSTGDACNIRRWNDLGRSAVLYRLLRPALVLLPLLAFAMQFLVPAHLAMAGDMDAFAFLAGMMVGGVSLQAAPLGLLALTLTAMLANIIYLSVMPGQAGTNLYGPDPRGDRVVPGGVLGIRSVADTEDDPVSRALAAYNRQRMAGAPGRTRPGTGVGHPAASQRSPGAFGKKRS